MSSSVERSDNEYIDVPECKVSTVSPADDDKGILVLWCAGRESKTK